MATAIEFKSVSKHFPDGTLGLADVTMFVAEGARACLLGPTGSGKTTVVRMLQAALRPTGGSVLLFDVSVNSTAYRKVRSRLGIVPQGPGMYPDLTAGEFMDLAAQLADTRYDRVVESLDLGEYLHTRMTYLPNNFQRRLALAAALVSDPDVLVLDEPTAGLDPGAAHDLKKYVAEAMRSRTSLLCTHNEAEAEELCTEVISLRAGRVVAQGTWDELRGRSRPRLRVAARQGVDRLLSQLAILGYDAEASDGSVLVRLAQPQHETPDMLRKLLDANIDVYECAPTRPSVESVLQEALR
jgi:ABC-2 type transport system ATP-binding protein